MSTIPKTEAVRADDIVIFIAPTWYAIPLLSLVDIEVVRLRYGLVTHAIDLQENEIIPVPFDPGGVGELSTNPPFVDPTPPAVPDELEERRNWVVELRRRWAYMVAPATKDLKSLIEREPTAFTDLLTSSILP